MPDLPCSEGQVVVAAPDQGIDFGGVTSCMTVTLLLSDGTKIAGHNGVDLFVRPDLVYLLGAKLREQTTGTARTLSSVRAIGSGGTWTPGLASSDSVIKSLIKSGALTADSNYAEINSALTPRMCNFGDNGDRLVASLAGAFRVQVGLVSFTDYDEGRIQIMVDGSPQLG